MASRFQAAALVDAPAYPNAVAWSDDNLLAVASGHLVTILNPALPHGPRGLITINSGEPFPIGLVDKTELLSPSLLPISLARSEPCVRSISWSPLGLAPNSGCLLAVCVSDGRVKLYRPPFCDFSSEWIEVVDLSAKLCDYLERISFGESEIRSTKDNIEERQTEEICTETVSKPVLRKEPKRRKTDIYNFDETYVDQIEENGSKKKQSKADSPKEIPEKSNLPLISAEKYASRISMLSSLVVSWSPVLQSSPRVCSVPPNGSSISLLAVGGKSGKVSLWRVSVPESFSIEHSHVATSSILVGIFETHTSWITAVCWALLEPESSNPRVILATGCCDGSFKIWLAYSEQFLKSGEVNNDSFYLLKEVATVDNVPVSVISLTVPTQSSIDMLLAVGKGSGSFDVLICDISNSKFDKVGSYEAHDNVVTGLAWAFDGRCLYSCSQDNFVRSWILCKNVLSEAPIPSNTPRLKSSTELPDVYVSCLGLAVSPGNLVIAMVRNFDEDFLDPMYQKRTQKASMELFWIGAQQLFGLPIDSSPFVIPGFPVKELVSWEVNILWSLKQYESQVKPLVVWDILAALSAFKHCAPEYVEHVLVKWLLTSSIGSHPDLSTENGLLHISTIFSEISTRRLHLLNIICRRVVLSHLKADQINNHQLKNLERLDSHEEKLVMWTELLSSSERELRERLVGLCFSYCTSSHTSPSLTDYSPNTSWISAGLAQMERWATLNHDYVKDQLRFLTSEVQKRLQSTSEFLALEQCCYCSASVPFESPEVGFCQSNTRGHKLARCAVSMKICPATTATTWFCTCCHRQVFKLAPETLFTLPRYPDFDSATVPSISKPLCPFCGTLLQRPQPDFLLSSSPV